MDELLVVVGVAFAILVLALPLVSFLLVLGARRRIVSLERERVETEEKLQWLYEQLRTREAAPIAPAPADNLAPDEDTAPLAPADDVRAERPPASGPPPSAEPDAPYGPVPPPPASAIPPAPKPPFEAQLAAWFTRIGAGALLLGALYFFKYAVDSEWIGPMGRVLVGAALGVSVLVAAEIARSRTRPAFAQVLVGIGLALLFISAYASSAFYNLFATDVAFAANVLILLVGALLAWRHRSEAILVLVTLAGFANPVLLSTGVDRPVALFSYLLLIGAVVLTVASLRRLPITILVTIVGTAALFAGWYLRFFEIFDLGESGYTPDVPPEQLVGAYRELSARVVPLAFVTLAALEWLAVAFVLHHRKHLVRLIGVVVTAALLLWHGGATALLSDAGVPLGIAMVVVGVSSVAATRALGRTKLLVLPMLVAFLLLAVGTGTSREGPSSALLALLGVWSGVYVVAFLYDALRAGRTLSTNEAVPSVGALFAFVALAALAMFPDRYEAVAIATLAASVVAGLVAYRARSSVLLLTVVVGMAIALGLCASVGSVRSDVADLTALLVVDVVWAALLTTLAVRLGAKDGHSRLSLVTAVVALLLGLVLTIVGTDEHVPTLRALLTTAFGAASLALATLHARAHPLHVTVFSTTALGLFAAAAAFGLSGATITFAWAVLFVVAAIIFSRAPQRGWLVATVLLAIAIVGRLVLVDVPAAEVPVHEFMASRGGRGALEIPFLFNPRAYGLVTVGVAALVAAAFVRRADDARGSNVFAALFAILGYTLLATLAITEARSVLTPVPSPPAVALDGPEFAAFLTLVDAARVAVAGTLDVATTVVLALFAIALLLMGFLVKDAFHRYLGLIVFLGTIGKLAGYDVWNLPRLYQVVVLTFVGAMLVAAGFLYARLKGLFAEGAVNTTAVLLLLLVPAWAEAEPMAPELDVWRYAFTAPIEGVEEAGYFTVPIAPDLYEKTRSSFTDLRIGAERREVPYVIQDVPAERPAKWIGARMYDPGEVADGAFRATFELNEAVEHCEVELDLAPSGDFLRRTRIETGPAPEDLQTVSEGSVVYAIVTDAHTYRSSTVRYAPSLGRFVRITVLPDPDADLTRIRGARFACITPQSVEPRHERALEVLKIERDKSARTTTVYLDARRVGTPFDRLELDIGTPEFVRRVAIGASDHQQVWPSVGSAIVQRIANDDAPVTLAIQPTKKRYFRLVFDDGDDAPLAFEGARGSHAAQRIVFSAREGGPHRLYVGRDDDAYGPRYDLAAILAKKATTTMRDASIGPLTPNPDFGDAPPRALPWTEQHRGTISIVLIGVLLGLAAWAVRLFVRP